MLRRGFGVLLGSPWVLLGSSWGLLGSSWELLGLLGSSWELLGSRGSSMGVLGGSWELLGSFWKFLRASQVLLGRSRGFLESSWVLLGSSWGLLGSSWELLGSAWALLGPGHEKHAKVASGKTSKFVTYNSSNAFSENTKTAFTEWNLRFWKVPGEAICHRSNHIFLGTKRPPEAVQARARPLRPPGPLPLYVQRLKHFLKNHKHERNQ